jgi:hypothetical protein
MSISFKGTPDHTRTGTPSPRVRMLVMFNGVIRRPSWQTLSAAAGVLPFLHVLGVRTGLVSPAVITITIVAGLTIAIFASMREVKILPTLVAGLGEIGGAVAGVHGWLNMIILREQIIIVVPVVAVLCLIWEAIVWLLKKNAVRVIVG